MLYARLTVLSILFLSTLTLAETSTELPRLNMEPLHGSVSSSNQLVFVRPEFSARVSFLENEGVPAADRYTLALSGDSDESESRKSNLAKLAQVYPGYEIRSAPGRVTTCELVLGASVIPCELAPVDGNHFSAFTTVSAEVGDRLKVQMATGHMPTLVLGVRYLAPRIAWSVDDRLPTRDLCRRLIDVKQGVPTVRSVMIGLAAQLSEIGLRNEAEVAAGARLISEQCLNTRHVSLVQRLGTAGGELTALLKSELEIQPYLPETWNLKLDILKWTEITENYYVSVEAARK